MPPFYLRSMVSSLLNGLPEQHQHGAKYVCICCCTQWDPVLTPEDIIQEHGSSSQGVDIDQFPAFRQNMQFLIQITMSESTWIQSYACFLHL
ncbi:hypothetical protein PoB_002964600 [Plakobranchus ocellatus]|uniref:Uncharacterized protein n=1 Tax=Plakobranchus ocellatus TaxID=259542 RepID=A0AAV4A4J3_9GAST|nr:hypothetical protein PoB_002964600 [Plakobranchus ocellatus]